MAETSGPFWLSTLVGLVFMLFISPFFPVGGPIVGGIIGGYLGSPGAVRGALGGLLGGLIVAAIFSVVAVVGGTAFLGPVGTLIGLGIAVLLFALALYFGILGAVGGAIGGALKAWMVSRRRVTG
ncbi:DUF5518 domain-containing protein [Methanoculleus sediminis]|uniref:DUF5518 domain-containing protein n=1 Tax=Methanoculleus sediminis TaxID=1550566 RepID=UPI0012E02805|nr:DUF5518 domain-containing protein [Methanoculleus sediminis]